MMHLPDQRSRLFTLWDIAPGAPVLASWHRLSKHADRSTTFFEPSGSQSPSFYVMMSDAGRFSSLSFNMAIFTVNYPGKCRGENLPNSPRKTSENGSRSAVRVCQVSGDAFVLKNSKHFLRCTNSHCHHLSL